MKLFHSCKNKWQVSALTLFLTLGTISSAFAQPVSTAARVPMEPKEVEAFADRFFEREDIRQFQTPGAAVVVVRDGKVVLQKGYGYADIAKKTPVDPEKTVFRLGSIAKSVTATAVMQLVEAKKIDLHKDIQNYMGDIPINNNFDEPLTMHQLLTHTTGFDFTEPKLGDINGDLSKVTPLKEYVTKNMPTVIRNPGESYNYDNFASMLQGYIVQNVSEISFEKYMDEHIFSRLGMKNSGFLLTPDVRAKLATAYDQEGSAYPPYTTTPTVLPQGGFFSTASDFSKFMIAHLNKGTYDGKRVLGENEANEMHHVQFSLNPKAPVMTYGFDFSNKNHFNGENVISKGGNIHGFSSKVWLLPDQNTGLFIATNSISNLRDKWFEAFMDHYYPAKAENVTYLKPTQAQLAKFEGIYSDLRSKIALTKVSAMANGRLLVEDAAGAHEFQQVDELLFNDNDGNRLVFQQTADGKIGYLQYRYELSTAKKLEQPQPFTDVVPSSDYSSSIHYLQLLDILKGKPDGSMGAKEPMTRGEFAKLAASSLFMSLSKESVVFPDTKNDSAAAAIQTLYELGVISAKPGTPFSPKEPIQRQEAAAIVARMLQLQGVTPMEARLDGNTDSWAVDSVKLIVALGLYGPEVTQNTDDSIDYQSKQPMLRQEAAILFAKALQL
ncbi:serine hydrolase [Brevibacillus reuszeri]|uniref:serine hydrolase n=1 Tax=Brevibacillus reuszeri TaxID=54915 RepID=UPI00289D58B4|nr:serine hydrolase [Brevibacillus reuszeri]